MTYLKLVIYNKCSKKAPFGYSNNKYGKVIVNEEEAMLVREIYRLFLLYKSYSKVNDEINASENFPEHPYKFTACKIESILHDVFYIGNVLVEEISDNQKVVLPFQHHGIVPNDIWQQVQSVADKGVYLIAKV